MTGVAAAASLKEAMEQRFAPVVLVLATDGAESACKKNGLTFRELLQPFAKLASTVHARTTGEPYAIRGFRVRLADFGGLQGCSEDRRRSYFNEVATTGIDLEKVEDENKMREVIGDVEFLTEQAGPNAPSRMAPQKLQNLASGIAPSLYKCFRDQYMASCRFSSFDTLDHPVACILAASVRSENAIAELRGMFTANQPLFLGHGVDAHQLVYYVLVNDVSAAVPNADVMRVFSKMKDEFGPNSCRLLNLNGNASGTPQVSPAKWTLQRTIDTADSATSTPTAPIAGLLTPEDEGNVGQLMAWFIEQNLLTHMSKRIKALSQSVSENRQGKFGKMMNYWLGSKNDEAKKAKVPGAPHFAPESCEMQIRKLGDLSFLLRDYDTAYSYYKMLKSELGTAESKNLHLYHAANLEALGMCTALQNKRDADTLLDQASTLYLRGRRHDFALRSRLTRYQHSKIAKGFRSAEIMRTASLAEEEANPLYAAIMQEEVAMAHLFCPPACGAASTSIRKFAFNLVLAGDRYAAAGSVDQALRVLHMAMAVYKQLNLPAWDTINEPLQLRLAQLWKKKGNLGKAVRHLGAYLVRAQTTPPKMVCEYDECVQALKARGGEAEFELPLPVLETKSAAVDTNPDIELWHSPAPLPGNGIISGCELSHDGVRQEWDAMEKDLLDAVRAEHKSLKLHAQYEHERGRAKRRKAKQYSHSVLVQGEEAFVGVKITNPLSVPIVLQEAVAVFEITDEQPSELASVNPPNPDNLTRGRTVTDVVLAGRTSMVLRLPFVSQAPGWVRVVGVEWVVAADAGLSPVAGGAMFYKSLDAGSKLCKDFVLRCCEAGALLRTELLDPPPLCRLDGEVTRSTLRLRNIGGRDLTELAIKVSPQNAHLLCLHLPAAAKCVRHEHSGLLDTVFLPDPIPRGGHVDVPMSIRAESGTNGRRAAVNHLPLVFIYGDDSAEPARRAGKVVIHSVVRPSVEVRTLSFPPSSIAPDARRDGDPAAFTVCVEMRDYAYALATRETGNPRGSPQRAARGLPQNVVTVAQVAALSADWDVLPLDPAAAPLPAALLGASALTLTFQVKQKRRDADGAARGALVTNCYAKAGEDGADVAALPYAHFVTTAMRDSAGMTGGAGGTGGKKPRQGGGMAMFLDRKEKRQQALHQTRGPDLVDDDTHPVAFALRWTTAAGQEGVALTCTRPGLATVDPQRWAWQDALRFDANLLAARGITSDALAANAAAGAADAVIPPPELIPPAVAAKQSCTSLVGVSLRYEPTVRHDFSAQVPCAVSLSVSLTNYHHMPRQVWFILHSTAPQSVGDTKQRDGAPQDQVIVTPCPTFYWQGKRKHKVSLGVNETKSLRVSAQVNKPGVVNLNQFSVIVVGDARAEVQGAAASNNTDWFLSVVHDDTAVDAAGSLHRSLSHLPPGESPTLATPGVKNLSMDQPLPPPEVLDEAEIEIDAGRESDDDATSDVSGSMDSQRGTASPSPLISQSPVSELNAAGGGGPSPSPEFPEETPAGEPAEEPAAEESEEPAASAPSWGELQERAAAFPAGAADGPPAAAEEAGATVEDKTAEADLPPAAADAEASGVDAAAEVTADEDACPAADEASAAEKDGGGPEAAAAVGAEEDEEAALSDAEVDEDVAAAEGSGAVSAASEGAPPAGEGAADGQSPQ